MPSQKEPTSGLNQTLTNVQDKETTARTGQPKRYGVKLLQYPEDLGNDDLKHFIEFNINVRGKSKFNKDNRLFEVKKQSDANLSAQELGRASATAAGVAGAFAGYGITSKIQKIAGRTGGRPTSAGTKAVSTTANLAGAAAGGVASAAIVSASELLKPDTLYRISDVISLYIDGPPTVKYGMNYSNKELGTLAGVLSGSSFEAAMDVSKLGGDAALALGTSLAKVPSALGATDFQALLGASSKTALNPFKEVLFESVDFRSFAFKYKFLPKSPREVQAVKDIIYTFKFHMHPEITAGKLFFIYPSEFEITYYFGSTRNMYFHKIASCVLESMEVNYGGEQFSSFKDGEPTEINMSLTFRETEILTKDMIEKGY